MSGSQILRLASRFAADRSGNFALITALLSTTVLLAAGFGINLAQSYEVKTSMRDALDNALTSTARNITTGKIDKKDARAWVETYLNVNRDTRFVTEGTYSLDTLVVNDLTKTVRGTVSANVALALPLFGMKSPEVRVNSAATYSDKQIEVAMMLDVTGSMAKTRRIDKIGALQDAAENAVNTMLAGQNPKNPRIRVALVPYSSGVNVGGLTRSVYTEKSGRSDLPPLANDGLFAKLGKAPSLPAFNLYTSIVSAAFPPRGNCATERKTRDGAADFSADGPDTVRTDKGGKHKYYALVNRDDRLGICPAAEVIPLTADSDALLASIKDFKADGYTAGAIAVQWAYYMLSPKWRSTIRAADLGDGPADTNNRKVSKVAILMTDGQFNTAYAGVSGNNNAQDATTRSNAQSICKNMKNDGIQIYTIGFDLPTGEAAEARAVLKQCASPDTSAIKHFYDVSTGAELDAAFKDIIRNQEIVALTQ